MISPLIDVKDVCKHFGQVCAVDRVSFTVEQGTCVGLLGPNGAGKTTMLRMLIGRSRRDRREESSIAVFGRDPLREELFIKSRSGVVPQDDNLDSELTAFQNLIIFSKFYHLPTKAARQRIEELLHFFELSEKRHARIRDLSGGMKRRLLIARALLNQPELLILDEPTTGLDPQVRHLIWDRIRHLQQGGVTILITTHYMEEAQALCDKVIIMHTGRVIMEGHPAELVRTNMEGFVLEVGRAHFGERRGEMPGLSGARVEETADTRFIYHGDFLVLNAFAERFPAASYRIRPSNLEDLFLKVTGRALHEGQ